MLLLLRELDLEFNSDDNGLFIYYAVCRQNDFILRSNLWHQKRLETHW
jgi:hypothetical protein